MAYEQIDNILFWKKPEQTLFVIKVLTFLPIPTYILLCYVRIRLLAVISLWCLVLSNSTFIKAIMKVVVEKSSFWMSSFLEYLKGKNWLIIDGEIPRLFLYFLDLFRGVLKKRFLG